MKTLPDMRAVGLTVALATGLWGLIFGLHLINFWLGMSLAAPLLAASGLYLGGWPFGPVVSWNRTILWSIGATVVLYGLFYTGNWVAGNLFAFAGKQVSAIYGIREEAPSLLIALVLLCITSPAEELYWRGFLQRYAMKRFGGWQGWLIAAALYGGVHLVSGNLMLTLAALVAGLFWGWLYWKTADLRACILSHALWTVTVFLLFPIAPALGE